MKICDGCGVPGLPRGHGVKVIEFSFGHGLSRTLDLCGDCRSSFHAMVGEWLAARPVANLADVVAALRAVGEREAAT